MNNIFLCGFMGVGKTYKGKRLAKALSVAFIDLDEEIVARTCKSIPQIFSEKGEQGFRDIESEILTAICLQHDNAVISTGGGIFTREENADTMKSQGKIYYLSADFALCYNRIKSDKNRPIAAEKSREELYELFLTRDKIYLQNADFTIDANKSCTEIIEEIIHPLK